jgi:hypothetical protein
MWMIGLLLMPGLAYADTLEEPYLIRRIGKVWQLTMLNQGLREAIVIEPQDAGWQINGVMQKAPVQINLHRGKGGAVIQGAMLGFSDLTLKTNNNFLNLLIQSGQNAPLLTSLRARPLFSGIKLTGPLLGKKGADVRIGHSPQGLLINGMMNQSCKINLVIPSTEVVKDRELKLILGILILAKMQASKGTG